MSRCLIRSLLVVLTLSVALIGGVAIGETSIEPGVVLQVLANKLWGAGYVLDPIDEGIVWNYRLTRALVAAACGAGLATCGVILQSLLRNPLADPYLLGISTGASTGAVMVALLGVGAGLVSLSAGAFAGAVTAFVLVILLARVSGSANGTGQIILAGIAGSQLFNALTAFLITRSASSEQARGIMFWLLGNLGGVRWPSVWLAVPVALLRAGRVPVASAGAGCVYLWRGLGGVARHTGAPRADSADRLRGAGHGRDGLDCRFDRFVGW